MATSETNARGLFKGLPWVLIANLLHLSVSAVLTLILPRFITPEEFGLWQLYQLWALYLGYVTFGYSDGLNLRLAGYHWNQLPKKELSTGLTWLFLLDAAMFAAVAAGFAFLSSDGSGALIAWACLGAVFYVPRTIVSIVFQSTGRAKPYALSLVIERLGLGAGLLLLLVADEVSTTALIVTDVVAKLLGLIISLVMGRDVFFSRQHWSRHNWGVFVADCRAGLSVLVANLTAMLINGGSRMFIVAGWGTTVFGQVSLAYQFAGLFMVAVNALAMSLLPNLKRLPPAEYPQAYRKLRSSLVSSLYFLLPLGFLLPPAIGWWLPDYELAGYYAALLFPLFVYEISSRGLSAVFLKALRMEVRLMVVNFVSMAVALACAALATHVLDSLDLAVLSILTGLATRAILSEIMVSRRLGRQIALTVVLELGIVVSYVAAVLTGHLLAYLGLGLLLLGYAAGMVRDRLRR